MAPVMATAMTMAMAMATAKVTLGSVIGHGDPIIAKKGDLLNSLSLVYDGDRQAPPGSSEYFQRFDRWQDLSRWLTRHDIMPESQVGYPPHQPEKIQRSFDRNL